MQSRWILKLKCNGGLVIVKNLDSWGEWKEVSISFDTIQMNKENENNSW